MAEEHPQFQAALAAVDAGDLDSLQRLLREHPELVHARSMSLEDCYAGYFHRPTLLHHVAGNPIRGELAKNIVAITHALLAAGADVDATCGGGPSQPTTAGGTTLGLLASGSQAHRQGLTAPLMEVLLAAGAKVDVAGDGGLFWSALYHTVEHQGQRDVARMLHESGHPLDLVFAAGIGERAAVQRYLIEGGGVASGADRFYHHHRREGRYATTQHVLDDALVAAAIGGQEECLTLLLEHGARLNTMRSWGKEMVTPLHGAIWAGWDRIARDLFARGADLTIRDPNNFSTPVGWAVFFRREALLIELTADDGRLDLLDATELGRTGRVRELLANGDPDRAFGPARAGVLIRSAAAAGDRAMVEALLELGADPTLENPEGKDAINWAETHDHDDIAELLRRHAT